MHREVGFSLLFDILILLFPVEKEIRERERLFATTCATTVYKLPTTAVSVPPRQSDDFQNAASSTNSGSLGQQPYRQHQRLTTTPTRISHARAIHDFFSPMKTLEPSDSFRRGPTLPREILPPWPVSPRRALDPNEQRLRRGLCFS